MRNPKIWSSRKNMHFYTAHILNMIPSTNILNNSYTKNRHFRYSPKKILPEREEIFKCTNRAPSLRLVDLTYVREIWQYFYILQNLPHTP